MFDGTYITDADVRDRALAWVPEVMRFASTPDPDDAELVDDEGHEGDADLDPEFADDTIGIDEETPRELAA